MGQILIYLSAVFLNAVNLFMQVFFAVMYSDLESDYINPVDLCHKLNFYLLPEMGLHTFLTLVMLVSGEWLTFILNVPLLAWNAKKVIEKNYSLDATEIFRTVTKHKRESLVKLGFHLVLFFYYLYSMIVAIVAAEDPKYS